MTDLRVLGDFLDEPDLWIDVTVTSVDIYGNATIEESTGQNPREWDVTTEQILGAIQSNEAIEHSEAPNVNHEFWNQIRSLHQLRGDQFTEQINSSIESSTERLFKAGIRVQR